MAHGCICDHCGAYTSESHGNEEYELLCEGCWDELGDDEDGIGNAYDDEGDLAYSDTARGEEHGVRSDPAHDNPRFPARKGRTS